MHETLGVMKASFINVKGKLDAGVQDGLKLGLCEVSNDEMFTTWRSRSFSFFQNPFRSFETQTNISEHRIFRRRCVQSVSGAEHLWLEGLEKRRRVTFQSFSIYGEFLSQLWSLSASSDQGLRIHCNPSSGSQHRPMHRAKNYIRSYPGLFTSEIQRRKQTFKL